MERPHEQVREMQYQEVRVNTGLIQRGERRKVQGWPRGPGEGSGLRDWVQHQGLKFGPIHVITQERESSYGWWGEKVMDSKVNVLIALCYNSLSPHPETECQLSEGQDCILFTFVCSKEHGT